jgi:SAM-dependent methyltransferase
MPVDWMEVTTLSFNSLLLLEQVQLSWFPGWLPEPELAIALRANTAVEWYFRHKCPSLNQWLDKVLSIANTPAASRDIRHAEIAVMKAITDLLVYVVDPAIYDEQPFLNWDSSELTNLVDFTNKVVVDIGAGTGRLALAAAPKARTIFAVEPVANLRVFLKAKARNLGLENIFPVDGLITDIPFPDDFTDVIMAGHVFGDEPEREYSELERVTRPDGIIALCPGNKDQDNERHSFLISKGFHWSRFEEPRDGTMRKYWKLKDRAQRAPSKVKPIRYNG